MYAVIRDRNQQTTVRSGDVVMCDLRSDVQPGDSVTFDEVLLVSDEGKVQVGTPTVKGASVKAEVAQLAAERRRGGVERPIIAQSARNRFAGTVTRVERDGVVEEPRPGRDVGDIGDPQPVGRCCRAGSCGPLCVG